MIEYEFNKKLNILEVIYEGEITLKDLLNYGNTLYEDSSLPRDLRVLTDVTKGNLSQVCKTNSHRELSWDLTSCFAQGSSRGTVFSTGWTTPVL